MKVFLLYFAGWLFIIGLACYFLGSMLVYLVLLGMLLGIVLDGDLIPWRKKRPAPQYYVPTAERKAA